jgi:hypothetical protein
VIHLRPALVRLEAPECGELSPPGGSRGLPRVGVRCREGSPRSAESSLRQVAVEACLVWGCVVGEGLPRSAEGSLRQVAVEACLVWGCVVEECLANQVGMAY